MPKVSIVIPTYNAAAYLPETLQHILAQDFQDFEIIIVDDCSTDQTVEIAKQLNSEKITCHVLENNHGGPSRPRSFGVQKAQGKYVALCDADDLFTKERLAEHVRLLNTYDDVAMVFSNVLKFDNATGNTLGLFLDGYDIFHSLPKQQLEMDFFKIAPEHAYACLFYENYIMPSGVTVRKKVFDTIGYFDETLTNGDDWDMWFRLTYKYPIGFWNKIGFNYRTGIDSISARGAKLAQNRIKVLNKQIEKNLPTRLNKRCKKLIATNYFGIGYHYQANGKMKQAILNYKVSLSNSVNLPALKGILIALSGANIYFKLKKLKAKLK